MLIKLVLVVLWLLGGQQTVDDPAIAYGQARVESRYEPTATSAQIGRSIYHRRTGVWPASKPFPKFWRGPFYCGLWQTKAVTESECIAQRDFLTAWLARHEEMSRWMKFCRRGIRCALNGHACGVAGALGKHDCKGYARRVIREAR